jgi:hypothetical protein
MRADTGHVEVEGDVFGCVDALALFYSAMTDCAMTRLLYALQGKAW